MRPTRLYINIDHVATVREARKTDEPDPVAAALLCEAAGADGITAHLREDRRHIQDHDVERLSAGSQRAQPGAGNQRRVVDLACRLRPYQATLVPERREEITTEGGLDLSRPAPRASGRHPAAGASRNPRRASSSIPISATLDAAKDLGVPAIELHTGRYAHSWRSSDAALKQLREAARYASTWGSRSMRGTDSPI